MHHAAFALTKKVVATLIVIGLFAPAGARAGFTDFHGIQQINNLDGNRVRIKLSGFINTDPLVPCVKNEFQMSSSETGFEMRMVMLMGAFFSGRKVRFSSISCTPDGRYLQIRQIHVHEDF